MKRPWMPLYIADYRKDTAHLSAAQHGAYLLLLMHYWVTGGLPNDDSQLARIACMSPAEWRKAKPIVAAFFQDWKHKRVDIEINKAATIAKSNSDKARDAAERRWSKERNGDAPSMPQAPPENAHFTSSQVEDRIGDARARGRSQFTEGSKALATAFLEALGIEPKATPPELAGVDWRAVSWETAGWTADLIDAETRRVGPGKPINYYEKCFATAFAKRNQPLPKVEVLTQETVVTTHAQPNARNGRGNIAAALDRLIADAERGRGIEGDEGSPRLLSNG